MKLCKHKSAPHLCAPCQEHRAEVAELAIDLERELCAQEAEKWLNCPRCKATATDIAAAIRARGGK